MNYSLKHLLLAGIAMLAGTFAYAQVTTSSMGGRVTDEKGEPVVGAAVVATHEPSGTVYGAIVNQSGQYAAPVFSLLNFDFAVPMTTTCSKNSVDSLREALRL